jgi:membrane protease subunit (stomatin/prohibitin family)
MGKFMQFQTGQAIPTLAAGAGSGGGGGGGSVVGDAVGLGAGVALGQMMANQLGQGLSGQAPGAPAAVAGAAAPQGVKAEDVMATLERLGELKAKGIVTQEEFDAKKAELLKKLV